MARAYEVAPAFELRLLQRRFRCAAQSRMGPRLAGRDVRRQQQKVWRSLTTLCALFNRDDYERFTTNCAKSIVTREGG